jgi:ribonuclease HI
MYFYAVAAGRQPGIYTDWESAKEQVNGFNNAIFKKFKSATDADAFMAKNNHSNAVSNTKQSPGKATSTDLLDSNAILTNPTTLVAFCDGSALKNGSYSCKAGYACVFPHNQDWNVAAPLSGRLKTNNRAEYCAALEALKRANIEDPSRQQKLYICTDSQLLINSMTKWIVKWKDNHWKKADGTPVGNQDLLQHLLAAQGHRIVDWIHVKAHTGKKDWKSRWNDIADRMAKEAAAHKS